MNQTNSPWELFGNMPRTRYVNQRDYTEENRLNRLVTTVREAKHKLNLEANTERLDKIAYRSVLQYFIENRTIKKKTVQELFRKTRDKEYAELNRDPNAFWAKKLPKITDYGDAPTKAEATEKELRATIAKLEKRVADQDKCLSHLTKLLSSEEALKMGYDAAFGAYIDEGIIDLNQARSTINMACEIAMEQIDKEVSVCLSSGEDRLSSEYNGLMAFRKSDFEITVPLQPLQDNSEVPQDTLKEINEVQSCTEDIEQLDQKGEDDSCGSR